MNKTLPPMIDPAGSCDNWGLLRSFYYIAAEQGVTRAARAQGVTQPSVSAALQRLETKLGQPLVQRGQRQFELTRRFGVVPNSYLQYYYYPDETVADAASWAEERLAKVANRLD